MWHALRAELTYFRPWLLGGLGLAAGVATLVSVIFRLVGEDGPPAQAAAGIRGMFVVMAPLVVGFIVQTYRFEERRARLLLAGSLNPRQMAGVMVLLPLCLLALAALAGALVMGTEALITGRLAVESLHIAGYVGGMLFMMLMLGLLIQEAVAAHRQRRQRAAVAGWAGLAGGVVLLAALSAAAFLLQGPLTWISLHLGNLITAAAAMAATLSLYTRRTDFTQ